MKTYPQNNIDYNIETPVYRDNTKSESDSRYSIYNIIDNLPFDVLEVKIANKISNNKTYNGYYYTTTNNETLYSIAKRYYNKESLYWVIAKANGLKNNGLSIIPMNTTVIVPNLLELQKTGGYFTNK